MCIYIEENYSLTSSFFFFKDKHHQKIYLRDRYASKIPKNYFQILTTLSLCPAEAINPDALDTASAETGSSIGIIILFSAMFHSSIL